MHVVAWASMYYVSYFRENVAQNELELASVYLYMCEQCFIHVLEALIEYSSSVDPFYIFTTGIFYV